MGEIIVISGPSGVGKTTLYKKLLGELGNKVEFSISATTRPPRVGEIDGKDYYFLSKEEFENKIKNNEFVEWAEVHGNYYGTLKSEFERILEKGKNILLDIDVQGGMNIKKHFPASHLIFISPPSVDKLKERLSLRNTDSESVLEIRIANAIKELEYSKFYDYNIVNDKLDEAYEELKRIVLSIIK